MGITMGGAGFWLRGIQNVGRRAACPQAAGEVDGGGRCTGGMKPSPTVDGKLAAKDVGGGVPDAPRRGQRLAAHNERRQFATQTRSCGCLPHRGKHCSHPGFAPLNRGPCSQPRNPSLRCKGYGVVMARWRAGHARPLRGAVKKLWTRGAREGGSPPPRSGRRLTGNGW